MFEHLNGGLSNVEKGCKFFVTESKEMLVREKYGPSLSNFRKNDRFAPPRVLTELISGLAVKQGNSNQEQTGLSQTPKMRDSDVAIFDGPIGIEDTRRALSQLIVAGDVSSAPINLVYRGERFSPIEGALIDYKRDFPTERQAQLKIIKHIQAFHNTFGGYIIFGAAEIVKDVEIIPVHDVLPVFDFKALRDLCREYFTAPIELQSRVHNVQKGGKDFQVILCHIPPRSQKFPVLVKKDAQDSSSKFILKRDDAYLREGDNSIAAATYHHWRILFGGVENPYIASPSKFAQRIRPIYNDLPDRDFICPEFIGRESYLSRLFTWLADDFSCVRILAGEGGLGKTSIAFEFASEVSRGNLIEVEAIIWLTAKKYQFRALINDYEELINSHFTNSRQLFESLARNLGEVRDDWNDLEESDFPRLLRNLGQHIKVFFVIDDLDSLEIDEQKRCIEVCQQLSGMGSRFLFTTRKNATASTSTAIEVGGLDEQEYEKLVGSWQERLCLKQLSEKDIRRLRETTHGSPLYTESLLRLVKNGIPVGEAIAKWKGNLGVDVRNAALKREVTQLGQEARKVLVTTAILGECSLAEIKVATEYSDQTLLDATNELQSLFLVNAPAIATQPRFSISKTTKELVLSLGAELIADYSSFQEKIRTRRIKSNGQSEVIKAVGSAVNQAMALISSGDYPGALQTVDEVQKSLKEKNKDLWFLRGRVLLKFQKPRLTEAKTAFMKAFDLGQRKPLFFDMWFNTLLDLEQFEGAVEVATAAIEASSGNKAEWLMRRAQARLQSAGVQDKRGDVEHAMNQIDQAGEDYALAAITAPSLRWDIRWKENFYRTNDSLWNLWARKAQQVPEWIEAFDVQEIAIRRGDLRLDTYTRMWDAYRTIRNLLQRRSDSNRTANLLAQVKRRGRQILADAPKELRIYKQYRNMVADFS
ncbi:MAG: putative DNA binding domain-containing protein [Pseudacidovorax sp.]|nr:putative DNA binding domain-containing protein [Pseudacidovorax sp.]